MTNANDPTRYPPPDPERVEHALGAMRARRARLRRLRAAGWSGALAVVVAIVAVALVSNSGDHLQVAGPTSSTTNASSTTNVPATTNAAPSTTKPTSTTTTGTSPEPPGTQQIVYQPFTATGAIDPDLHVNASVTGTCVTGESSRTYRCFGALPSGLIYDPCFVLRQSTQTFVCPTNPTNAEVVELTATSPASGTPNTTIRPWAFQLSSGEVCLFVSAAWSGLGPYDCQRNDPSVAPADCRPPASQQPWWSADCQDEKSDASPFTARPVSKVWF